MKFKHAKEIWQDIKTVYGEHNFKLYITQWIVYMMTVLIYENQSIIIKTGLTLFLLSALSIFLTGDIKW